MDRVNHGSHGKIITQLHHSLFQSLKKFWKGGMRIKQQGESKEEVFVAAITMSP
jgi:hypothetical protein